MVWGRIHDALSGTPKLDEVTTLPDYFPVQPQGCERHAEKLFSCLAKEATDKARDLEKAGYAKSYYDSEATTAPKLEQKQEPLKKDQGENSDLLPSPNDNPLDACKLLVAYYKRCCDRELKKKKNWILTEPYRVQEEYRYSKPQTDEKS